MGYLAKATGFSSQKKRTINLGIVHKHKHININILWEVSFVITPTITWLVLLLQELQTFLFMVILTSFFFCSIFFTCFSLICYSMSSTIIQRKTSLPVWQTLAGSLAILMWCMDLCVMEAPQCSVNFTEHIRMLVSAKYWKH